MNRRGDAFDILSSHDPVDETRLDDHRSPHARRLFASIVSQPRRPVRTRRRYWRIAGIAVAALAVIAAAWITLRPISTPTAIGCYRSPSLDSDVVAVESGGTLDPSVCTPIWRYGPLVNTDIVPAGSVPPFVGCVTDTGSLAVFPSDDPNLCGQLGLAVPDEQSKSPGETVRHLQDTLDAYFATHHCVPLDEAHNAIEDILAAQGLSDWTIQAEPPRSDRPCTSFGLDPQHTTIHLVPIQELGQPSS
ncbi:MAG: hypothetical protein GXP34_10650 [Actinobacteria bacterium]|nr:hypothetical protein [Actinomycetota bacterium]